MTTRGYLVLFIILFVLLGGVIYYSIGQTTPKIVPIPSATLLKLRELDEINNAAQQTAGRIRNKLQAEVIEAMKQNNLDPAKYHTNLNNGEWVPIAEEPSTSTQGKATTTTK